ERRGGRKEGRQSKNHRARQRRKSSSGDGRPWRGWRESHELGLTLQAAGGADARTTGGHSRGVRFWSARAVRRTRGIHHQDQGRRQGSLAKSHDRRGYAHRDFGGRPLGAPRNTRSTLSHGQEHG